MVAAVRQVLDEARQLTYGERAELIEQLIIGQEQESPPPLSDAWLAEIRRRSAELDAGLVKPIPWEEVRRQIREEFDEDAIDE